MKTFRFILLAFSCLVLTSCLEITEETTISENGSGQYVTAMDLGQLVDMMQAMGGEEFDKRKDEKIDSIIYLKDVVDTAKNLTQEQKDLLRPGSVSVKLDLTQKIFKLEMKLPFKSLADLQKVNEALGKGKFGFGSIAGDMMNEKKGDKNGDSGSDIEKLLSVFDTEIKDGSIKRKLNEAKHKMLNDDPKMAEIKQGAEMGIEVTQSTVYKLPRPVKKVSNNKATISDDKKTVTLKTNLMEIFEKPEQFEFKIEY